MNDLVATDHGAEHTAVDSDTSLRNTESKKCIEIRDALPDSTPTERLRFLASRAGNTGSAIDKLGSYLEWHHKHCLDDSIDSDKTWEFACRRAIELSIDEPAPIDTKLPCILFVHEYSDGTATKRCVQVLPPRIDTNIANPLTYALA